MNQSSWREFSLPPILLSPNALWRAVTTQGAMVTYERPKAQAVAPEPTGTQKGIVLSSSRYNRSGSDTAHICPLELTQSGKYSPRPDLTTSVPIQDLDPMICDSTQKPWAPIPLNSLKPYIDAFIDIITPTPAKMREQADGYNLAYGQMTYFYSIPYSSDPTVLDYNTPGLWLMPREAFKKAGRGFVLRTHSNTIGNSKHDVVEVVPSFCPERVCTGSMQSLSPLRIRENEKRARFDQRALRGIVSKIKGHFFDEDADRVSKKYGEDFPAFVSDAILRFHKYNSGHQHRPYR